MKHQWYHDFKHQNSVNFAYLDLSLEPQSKQKRLLPTSKNVAKPMTGANALFSESPLAPHSEPARSACGCVSVRLSCLTSKLLTIKRNRVGGRLRGALLIGILTANINDIHLTNERGASIRIGSRQKKSYSSLTFTRDTLFRLLP